MKDEVPASMFRSTLRDRLFHSLLPLLAIQLGLGILAVVLLSRVGWVMDSSRSLTAIQQMRLALDQIENDLIGRYDERADVAWESVRDGLRLFGEGLKIQAHNVSLPREQALTRSLQTQFHFFQELVEGAVATGRPGVDPVATIYPPKKQITAVLNQLQELNEEGSPDRSASGRKVVGSAIGMMLLGLSIGLVVSAVAAVLLARGMVQPIAALEEAIRGVTRGEWGRPVPVTTHDELGRLAHAFNQMAAELKRFRDLTDQKLVHLHKSRDATLATFPDPIYVLDADAKWVTCNPAAARLAEALAMEDPLPPELSNLVEKVRASGRDFLPEQFDAVLTLHYGQEDHFYLPRILLMREADREVFGVAAVLLDVTRFRLLDDAKTNLVGTVSHELRTPLTSVRMVLHMLLERSLGPLTPGQAELIATARHDAERVLRILNDLLDLSRLEQGKADLQLEPAEPESLVHQAIATHNEAAQARNVVLEADVLPGLPYVRVDNQRLSHVFGNLLANAIKYSPPNGQVWVRASQTRQGEVRFSVRDQGPGIPADYQVRVFDRFFRIPGQEKTGAGLGLSIAREIVVAHGGRIGVNSSPSGGSEFFFILPADASLEPAPSAAVSGQLWPLFGR